MSELTAALATIEKCREITGCPAGVDLQDHLRKLVAERDASLNAERVWEKTMMEVCGEDGPASVANEIRALQGLRDTAMQALKSQVEQLAAENAHLASRKQRLIEIIQNANNDYCMCGDLMKSHVNGGCGYPTGMFDYHYNKWLEEEDADPATDRIVAWIKADGVEEFAESQKEYVRQHRSEMDQMLRAAYAGSAVDAERFAKQLREGVK